MRISALALKLPETYFYGRIDRHISRVRVRNYPAQTTPARPGQIRAGEHSDYVSLTILATEDKPGGLQVCKAQGDEVDMPIVPICFIINLGDLWRVGPAASGPESRRVARSFHLFRTKLPSARRPPLASTSRSCSQQRKTLLSHHWADKTLEGNRCQQHIRDSRMPARR